MNIYVIKSSPHKYSSSGLLADEFIKGTKENGHSVEVFDAGHKKIEPCSACDYCLENGSCFKKDDMKEAEKGILESDMVVFVTPLYCFGVSAQLKLVWDRFYSFAQKIMDKKIKTVFICAGGDDVDWAFEAIELHYKTFARYIHFEDCGIILAKGCGTTELTKNSKYMQDAYELGKSL
ncbi:MAG: flavodoxin family protein [Abditibacteriota bacterium]|nr:flavodoxin family protein [Abditibacteriota bacterium]